MSNDTLKYIPSIALKNYGMVLVLLAVVFFASRSQGALPQIILLKLAMVPLVFLAPRGLASIYRQPIIEHKVTARGIEYILLSALIASLAVFLVLWAPESSVQDLLKSFFTIFAMLAGVLLVFMAIDIYRRNRQRKSA